MKRLLNVHINRNFLGAVIISVVLLGSIAALPPAAERVNAFAAANLERKLPIYCVQTEEPKVSVSFDAAWGAEDTDELLRILEENEVKATFFLCGYWVEKYPDEVKKIAEAGHDLGNHSATHPHMSQLSAEQITEELQKCHQNVKDLTGIEMELFRPPFGEYDNKVIETATKNDYYTIQWDIDSLDWKEQGTEAEINQVLNHKHLGNGSIILFHNDAKYTPQVLDTILKGIKEKGYEIVPISELIHRGEFELDHEGRQIPKT
ncbi:MAG: polysaccharide deacetylase family protein [Anaerotignum sp.]|nr:polysaccharide deacetylase family protein [Anaerotignum sp.]